MAVPKGGKRWVAGVGGSCHATCRSSKDGVHEQLRGGRGVAVGVAVLDQVRQVRVGVAHLDHAPRGGQRPRTYLLDRDDEAGARRRRRPAARRVHRVPFGLLPVTQLQVRELFTERETVHCKISKACVLSGS